MGSLTVTVNLDSGRDYVIHVGPSLLQSTGFLLTKNNIAISDVVIVTNEIVAPLYLETLTLSLINSGVHIRDQVVLQDGEETKNWHSMELVFDRMVDARAERSTALLALGGGVIGDLTGFIAACYMRGVPYVQIPTTLLAQVDSSVGGKTAINHPRAKNMLGAFYQPRVVIADTKTLDSLPDRELRSGLAEVIKYGLISDSAFFEWLETNIEHVLNRSSNHMQYLVTHSCRNKAEIVALDEREAGPRTLLNLGHTFGHVIETLAGYGCWLHGEAVAVGMIMAAELSNLMGWLAEKDVIRIRTLLLRAGLPIKAPALNAERYTNAMLHDKKVKAGRINFVLLKGIGTAVIFGDVDDDLLKKAIEKCC